MRTHVDLFSGIGGFALAAQANDVQTISFCEIDQRCREFLGKAWPGVDIHDDINTFDAVRYAGRTWLLTAGVPCQPASRAGKQLGSADNRWLWPQAIRCFSEIRPAWAIFENPPGIRDVAEYGVQPPVDADDAAIGNIGDVFNRTGLAHIHQILEAIEAQGYAVQVYSLPAASVNAPHLRERYWIVAHNESERHQERGMGAGEVGREDAGSAQTTVAAGIEGKLSESVRNGRIAGQLTTEAAGHRGPVESNDGSQLADARRLGSGQDEPRRGADSRTVDRRDRERMGDAERVNGGGRWQQEWSAPRPCVGNDRSVSRDQNTAESNAESPLADAEKIGHGRGRRASRWNGSGAPSQDGRLCNWDNAVWVPCADNKFRRAPDDSFDVAHGLHRSLLGALGNTIVPQVAQRIIAAMIEAECDA